MKISRDLFARHTRTRVKKIGFYEAFKGRLVGVWGAFAGVYDRRSNPGCYIGYSKLA